MNTMNETTITKQTWLDAGNGEADIDIPALEAKWGKCEATTWEGVCDWVYQKLTGKRLECPMRGRGFRSRWYGERVAEVWPD